MWPRQRTRWSRRPWTLASLLVALRPRQTRAATKRLLGGFAATCRKSALVSVPVALEQAAGEQDHHGAALETEAAVYLALLGTAGDRVGARERRRLERGRLHVLPEASR